MPTPYLDRLIPVPLSVLTTLTIRIHQLTIFTLIAVDAIHTAGKVPVGIDFEYGFGLCLFPSVSLNRDGFVITHKQLYFPLGFLYYKDLGDKELAKDNLKRFVAIYNSSAKKEIIIEELLDVSRKILGEIKKS